jgi:hypothetical protein
MEILRMDYRFTALLIIMFIGLTVFCKPAYPRNEYLNEYGARCGDMEFRVEQRDENQDYRGQSSSDYERDNQNFSVTYRKYLGVDCKTIKENVAIKQQLELMKMCGRVNANPSLAQNENFRLLVMKCRGVTPARDNTRPGDSKSLWDDMKDGYKKENPELTLMGDKIIGPSKSKLKIPPKDYILPLPKPKNED